MNTKITGILSKAFIFAAGVAVGVGITWKYFTSNYQEVASEEEVTDPDEPEDDSAKKESEKKVQDMIIEKMNYASMFKGDKADAPESKENTNNKEEEEDEDVDKPYVISPEEFDTEGYKTESLVLYSDGVLVNGYGIPVDNVDEVVGEDSLTHFGEYEEDSVFVRNDVTRTDYEILRDEAPYRNESTEV